MNQYCLSSSVVTLHAYWSIHDNITSYSSLFTIVPFDYSYTNVPIVFGRCPNRGIIASSLIAHVGRWNSKCWRVLNRVGLLDLHSFFMLWFISYQWFVDLLVSSGSILWLLHFSIRVGFPFVIRCQFLFWSLNFLIWLILSLGNLLVFTFFLNSWPIGVAKTINSVIKLPAFVVFLLLLISW